MQSHMLMDPNINTVPLYILLFETNDGRIIIARSGNEDGPLIVAREGNQSCLRTIGDRMIEKKLISAYQLLKTASPPIRSV